MALLKRRCRLFGILNPRKYLQESQKASTLRDATFYPGLPRPCRGALFFFCWNSGTARADRSVTVSAALTSIGPLVPGYSPWPLRGQQSLVMTLLCFVSGGSTNLPLTILLSQYRPSPPSRGKTAPASIPSTATSTWRQENPKACFDIFFKSLRHESRWKKDIATIVPEGQRTIARDKRGRFRFCFTGRAPSLVMLSHRLSCPGRDAGSAAILGKGIFASSAPAGAPRFFPLEPRDGAGRSQSHRFGRIDLNRPACPWLFSLAPPGPTKPGYDAAELCFWRINKSPSHDFTGL